MKKTQLLFIAAIIIATLFTQQASAKIWRVNNQSNYDGSTLWGDNFGGTQSYPVFAQINQVINLASSGDSIYVEASPIRYADASLDRKLIIIGAGYFLSRNPHVSTNTDSSFVGEMDFNAGSEGSQLIGMTNVGFEEYVSIGVNDITIKRCYLSNAIHIATNLNSVYIIQNFINVNATNATALGGNGIGYVYPTDLIFNNNICKNTLVWSAILQCNNNTFDGPANNLDLSFTTSEFKNNILKALNATTNINNGTNLNVSYNIGTLAAQFGTANNNILVSAINTIFVTSSSLDGIYQVADGSVADNSGSDGTDRGAFGGAPVKDRYTLSGLAAIPVIYSVTTPGATATNLPLTIQARTIK